MMQFFILMTIIFNTVLFMIMNHPLTMGLILMIQTLLIALFSGMFSMMYWFSYSLFLIFMGGMLILFMYMTSLASNETFTLSINLKMISIIFLLISTILFYLFFFDFKNLVFHNKTINEENMNLETMNSLMTSNTLMLNKMYNFPMNFITVLLVMYLFLTLITSVKITNIFSGPLRMKNY